MKGMSLILGGMILGVFLATLVDELIDFEFSGYHEVSILQSILFILFMVSTAFEKEVVEK